MGGGDLNMKKSWHPLLMKNQERVWKEERKAIEERKKTAQLQKELAEERQVQELQRLHAAQGKGFREEKLDWLYAAPAEGNGISSEEQEAYLLGRKTVDKLFKEKDEAAAKLAAKAAHQGDADKPGGGFISLQNANTLRDTAAKIREDPLFAIKQQEQAVLESLKKNPARVQRLQSQSELKGESKREKETRRKEKHKRAADKERKRRHGSYDSTRERDEEDAKRSRYDASTRAADRRSPSPRYDQRRHRASSPDDNNAHHHARQSSRFGPSVQRDDHEHRHRSRPSSSTHDHNRYSKRVSPPTSSDRGYRRGDDDRHRQSRPQSSYGSDHPDAFRSSNRMPHRSQSGRLPGGASAGVEPQHEPPQAKTSSTRLSEAKAAKLAQMEAAAQALSQSRSERLKQLEAEDSKKLKEEEALREKNRIKSAGGVGDGSRAKFVRDQEKKVFFGDMGLAERVKRSGGVGLVKERE